MKAPSVKPSVFIGSSSEGLAVARSAHRLLSQTTECNLWENDIFLPGAFTLETLETQLAFSSFAVLVATADDHLVKRGTASAAMRDNVLFECGLFMGALGRRRTFLLVPTGAHVELPTDLAGLLIAKYVPPAPATGGASHLASLEEACHSIQLSITREWRRVRARSAEFADLMAIRKEHAAFKSLSAVSARILLIITALPRNAAAFMADRETFDRLKRQVAEEIQKLALLWVEEARLLGVRDHLDELVACASKACMELPFAEDILIEEKTGLRARNLAISRWLFGDPHRERNPEIDREVKRLLQSLSTGLERWWAERDVNVTQAAVRLQTALIAAAEAMTYLTLERAAHPLDWDSQRDP